MSRYLAVENGNTNKPTFFLSCCCCGRSKFPCNLRFESGFETPASSRDLRRTERCLQFGAITEGCTLNLRGQVLEKGVSAIPNTVLRVCSKQWGKNAPRGDKIHIEGEENAKVTGRDKKYLKVDVKKLQVNP